MSASQFRLLATAAFADGKVQREEHAALVRAARALGLGVDEAREVLDSVRRGDKGKASVPRDPAGRRELLERLAGVLASDGVIRPQEKALLQRLAPAFQLEPAEVQSVLERALDAAPSTSSDPIPKRPSIRSMVRPGPIRIGLHPEDPDDFLLELRLPEGRNLGEKAEARIVAEAKVIDSRPVNGSQTLWSESFTIGKSNGPFRVPRSALRAFNYRGTQLRIELYAEVVRKGMFGGTSLCRAVIDPWEELSLGLRPAVQADAKTLVEPKDCYNFARNLRAISPLDRLAVLAILGIGSVLIAINSLIGFHDQFSPPHLAYFYDHRDSKGKSEPPLEKAAAGDAGLAALMWWLLRGRLRRYMSFSLVPPRKLGPEVRVSLGELVRGRPRVDLLDVELRVVAANIELGQYTRGSDKKRRTVSFEEPVRAVVVHRQTLARIPKGADIQRYLSESFTFEAAYRSLYPPVRIGARHGLKLHWEVQLIHPDYVDQELAGPEGIFRYEDFGRA